MNSLSRLNELPSEILFHIFGFICCAATLMNLSEVCKQFSTIVNCTEGELWSHVSFPDFLLRGKASFVTALIHDLNLFEMLMLQVPARPGWRMPRTGTIHLDLIDRLAVAPNRWKALAWRRWLYPNLYNVVAFHGMKDMQVTIQALCAAAGRFNYETMICCNNNFLADLLQALTIPGPDATKTTSAVALLLTNYSFEDHRHSQYILQRLMASINGASWYVISPLLLCLEALLTLPDSLHCARVAVVLETTSSKGWLASKTWPATLLLTIFYQERVLGDGIFALLCTRFLMRLILKLPEVASYLFHTKDVWWGILEMHLETRISDCILTEHRPEARELLRLFTLFVASKLQSPCTHVGSTEKFQFTEDLRPEKSRAALLTYPPWESYEPQLAQTMPFSLWLPL